jgi:predicted RND superfamily exporter protein
MPPTQIIPSFLLAMGVGGAVHLLAIFYQARRRGDDEESAVSFALAHSGLPIIMTCLTTAGGLLSFVPAALRPISHFGAITPVGVLISLFFTLTLLPAMIAVFPMRAATARRDNTVTQRLLLRVGALSTGHRGLVVAAWAALLLFSAAGLTRLTLNHHMLEWFPAGDATKEATIFLNEKMGGAASLELLIATGRENGFHEPELLRKLDRIALELEALEVGQLRAGKTLGLTDVVKETHRALNENRESFYEIPGERTLVAQELLLFENTGSDDVEDFVDSQFSTGRITVRMPFTDAAAYDPYLEEAMALVERELGADATVEPTGMLRLLANTVTAALQTMILSYVSAFIVITLLMVLLIGNLRMGLVAMIPNLVPVAFTLGLMGWLGIPLDMFTLMIGTIAIGLAVDDTIHFMHNFRRYYDETGDPEEAVQRTLSGAGQAMLFTTLVLAAGFLVYTQAYMVNLIAFGMLTATAISLAFIADVTLAPALVTMLTRKRSDTPPA